MEHIITKNYVEKELKIIILNLYEAKRNYQLFKNMTSGNNYNFLCKRFPYFSNVVTNSLFRQSIIIIWRTIYDCDKKSVSINNMIDIYLDNPNIFTLKKYYYIPEIGTQKKHRIDLKPEPVNKCILKINEDLKKYKFLGEYLKKSRNKLFAHNDKKFNFNSKKKIGKSKIKYEDIERFIDLILEDINVLYRSLTGSTYAFSYYELDEINYISNLIEKDSHKYDNLKYKTPKKP